MAVELNHTQIALVTGSTRGIGAAIAAEFARRGAAVVVHGRDQVAADRVAAAIMTPLGGWLAAHIGRKLVHHRDAISRRHAILFVLQIQRQVHDPVRHLVPLLQRLYIHCPNDVNPIRYQAFDEMSANKASCTANDRGLPFEVHQYSSDLTWLQ